MNHTNIFEKALLFAAKAHSGMIRKDGKTPYFIHPMEVAAIAASMTDDENVLAAALLHDTVEDTSVTMDDIRAGFGERIAALVASETENKRSDLPPADTWKLRKEETLAELKTAPIEVKILWLSDKLSNMRSFYHLYLAKGDALWQTFNQKDPLIQAWYYRTVAQYTEQLRDHHAWQEYTDLLDKVFPTIHQKGTN